MCLEVDLDLDAVFEEVLALREHILRLREGWNPGLASEVTSRPAGLDLKVYIYGGGLAEEGYPASVIDVRKGSEFLRVSGPAGI